MDEHGTTIRSLVMPLALVGLAVSMPAGAAPVRAEVADQVVQTTVDRAEAFAGQLSQVARRWIDSRDYEPVLPVVASVETFAPSLPIPSADPAIARIASQPLPGPVADLSDRPQLIDLPPPM